jgi:phosphonopyruvate decarboxylase
MGPVAILVRAGTFGPYDLAHDVVTDFPMNREDAVKCIAGQLAEKDIVVATTGKTSRELYEYRVAQGSSGNDFLTVGGMGHTASIAMGIARVQPDRLVVCLDGDGSLIMHMGALGVIGNAGLANLLHVVINNGAHDSVGGQPTVGYDIDIPAIAIACGYREAASVSKPHELKEQIVRLREQTGPVLLEVKVNKGARADLGRPKSTPLENRDALMTRLGL